VIVKVTIAFALALAIAALSRRAAASTRHAILAAGQIVALLIPLLMFVMPPMKVESPGVQRLAAALPKAESGGKPPHSMAITPPQPRYFDFRLLWLLGTLAFAVSRTTSYIRAANVVRRAKRFGDVLISDEVAQPVTLGHRVILPRTAATWDAARLRAVLLHERAHVARHDSLLAVIGDAATAIYWFHPLAWLVARRAMLERERACDEAVLAGGVAPTEYAGAIVDVARSLVGRRVHGLAMADRSHLETRVMAILDPSLRRRATVTARAFVVIAALVAAPFLAALTPRGGEPDLLGDAIASPLSERIAIDEIPNVPAAGPDAALIAVMQDAARIPQREHIDFVAFRARWALSQVRNGELVLPLIERLGDPDWRIRAYAAWGLGIARDARATPALMDLMNDDIWRVRAMAASAIAQIADPIAASSMQRALGDDAWQVRTPAVHYFAAVGADRELFQRMTKDRHLAVRTAAEEALR
jgi:beta-lactamase regulating signal transducer with metallopeptidase domain